MVYLRELDGQAVTLLEERLLLHVILGQYLLVITVHMLIGTVFIHARCVLQKEFTILGPAKRGFHESALEDKGVYGEHGNGGFLGIGVSNVY